MPKARSWHPVTLLVTVPEACALLDAIVLESAATRSEAKRAILTSLFARVKLARDDAQRAQDLSAARDAGLLRDPPR